MDENAAISLEIHLQFTRTDKVIVGMIERRPHPVLSNHPTQRHRELKIDRASKTMLETAQKCSDGSQ